MKRIILIARFESCNANLYIQAKEMATEIYQGLEVIVFSDRNLVFRF